MLYPQEKKSTKELEIEKFVESVQVPKISNPGFAAKCVHVGQEPDPLHGSVNVPIYMTSLFKLKACTEMVSKYAYTRILNPTNDAFEQCLAALEHGRFCRSYSSGMAPIYTVFSLFSSGDHFILPREAYSNVVLTARDIFAARNKVEVDYVDMTDAENVRKAVKPNTKLIWMETPSNPLLSIIDIEAVVKIAKEHGIMTGIDNTISTPYLTNPLLFGVDIVMHSYTKYIAGHSDVMGGALIMNDPDLFKRVTYTSMLEGNCASPFNGYLALRGLKTFKCRFEEQCKNSFIMAHWLKEHRNVVQVYHPGMPDHAGHETAKRQMRGFGGMLAFKIKGDFAKTQEVVMKVKLYTLGASLGGVDSHIMQSVTGTHALISKEEREAYGITDNLIRISVGIECVVDLILDLDQALDY